MASSITTVKIAITSTSTPYSFGTGTTSTSTTNTTPANNGMIATFQNQGAATITIGGSDILTAGGVTLAANGTYQLVGSSPSNIQLNDWFVISTSSAAVAVVQILKKV